MANYIKPFATNPDASVMTNDELANADELKRGFIPKSKADSRLIGKLIQNSTAGAYVIGEFVSTTGGVDVDPSKHEEFSTNFQQALKTFVNTHAPQQDLTPYQTKDDANSQHQQLTGSIDEKLDITTADQKFETKTNVTAKIDELSQSIDTKLGSKADVQHTHTIENVTGLQAGLDAKAATSWVTSELAEKANIANPTFTGTVNGPLFKGDLTGNVTGNVTGNAATATKAIQDDQGRQISSTYVTKEDLSNSGYLEASAFGSIRDRDPSKPNYGLQ